MIGNYLDTSNCLPSGPRPTLSSAFYSPGLYCPAGYSSACGTTLTVGTVTESRAICCPIFTASDLGSNLPDAQMLCQTSTDYPWYQTFGCTLSIPSSNGQAMYATIINSDEAIGTVTTIVPSSTGGLNAYSVQIRWQASDLEAAKSSTSSTLPLSSTMSTKLSSTSSTVSPTNSDESSTNSSGLSKSTQIALSVVFPLVAIFAMIGIFFFIRRHRKSRLSPRKTQNGSLDISNGGLGSGEYQSLDNYHQKPELSAESSRNSRNELAAEDRNHATHTTAQPAELD